MEMKMTPQLKLMAKGYHNVDIFCYIESTMQKNGEANDQCNLETCIP